MWPTFPTFICVVPSSKPASNINWVHCPPSVNVQQRTNECIFTIRECTAIILLQSADQASLSPQAECVKKERKRERRRSKIDWRTLPVKNGRFALFYFGIFLFFLFFFIYFFIFVIYIFFILFYFILFFIYIFFFIIYIFFFFFFFFFNY